MPTEGRFVAVGISPLGDVNKIGSTTDGGEVWTLATTTNGLFGGGVYDGFGISITYGNGRFVAVGTSSSGENNKIGYSTDGKVWTLATNLNGLFLNGLGLGVTYGNGRFVAVGGSDLGEVNKIGYSPDGEVWTLATNLNGLFGGGGGGWGIAYAPPPPITNICFPAGTPIQTDQGIVLIEKLDIHNNTINHKAIRHITQSVTLDKYLISLDKHSLGRNVPNKKTIMTKDHKIMFEGRLVPAYRFLDYSDQVKKVKYNGELLYNVILTDYGLMNVNDLVCETLHPENIIAKLYISNYTVDETNNLISELNTSLIERDFTRYTKIINKIQ
jgi:hypothetical protein